MDFPITLLEALKKRFEETNGPKKMGGCTSQRMRPYYVRSLKDNLVQPMDRVHRREYARGAGVELGEKMRALRSSAAMTFNLLGNRTVQVVDDALCPVGAYDVSYEYQLPTLAGNPNRANLDARLSSADGGTVVYCEMKLAEWMLGWMKMLRVSYFDPKRYFITEEEARVFIDLFTGLVVPEANMKGSHKTRFTRFDALQMAKHVLAIYSNLEHEQTRTIKLVTCIWEIDDPSILGRHEKRYRTMIATERAEFAEFAETMRPVLDLFEERGVDFSLEYVPFDRFLACLDKSDEQKAKLARYLL